MVAGVTTSCRRRDGVVHDGRRCNSGCALYMAVGATAIVGAAVAAMIDWCEGGCQCGRRPVRQGCKSIHMCCEECRVKLHRGTDLCPGYVNANSTSSLLPAQPKLQHSQSTHKQRLTASVRLVWK
jgi:hypothetical protein